MDHFQHFALKLSREVNTYLIQQPSGESIGFTSPLRSWRAMFTTATRSFGW